MQTAVSGLNQPFRSRNVGTDHIDRENHTQSRNNNNVAYIKRMETVSDLESPKPVQHYVPSEPYVRQRKDAMGLYYEQSVQVPPQAPNANGYGNGPPPLIPREQLATQKVNHMIARLASPTPPSVTSSVLEEMYDAKVDSMMKAMSDYDTE